MTSTDPPHNSRNPEALAASLKPTNIVKWSAHPREAHNRNRFASTAAPEGSSEGGGRVPQNAVASSSRKQLTPVEPESRSQTQDEDEDEDGEYSLDQDHHEAQDDWDDDLDEQPRIAHGRGGGADDDEVDVTALYEHGDGGLERGEDVRIQSTSRSARIQSGQQGVGHVADHPPSPTLVDPSRSKKKGKSREENRFTEISRREKVTARRKGAEGDRARSASPCRDRGQPRRRERSLACRDAERKSSKHSSGRKTPSGDQVKRDRASKNPRRQETDDEALDGEETDPHRGRDRKRRRRQPSSSEDSDSDSGNSSSSRSRSSSGSRSRSRGPSAKESAHIPMDPDADEGVAPSDAASYLPYEIIENLATGWKSPMSLAWFAPDHALLRFKHIRSKKHTFLS
ncbi:hypothetical protein PQX77_019487 [Marasmius sp. AFHP31]|nr:hypothetical protein PQX77_019487 [Marasmius sp. AFHP31]